jgi:hypothetical protein
MTSNPWQVESIQEFSCLKCPECGFDTKEENLFENHATENHPLSFVFFVKKLNEEEFNKNVVKEEPISDSSDMEENGDDEKLAKNIQFLPLHYPEVSLTEENSIVDISKIKKEIPFTDPLDIIVNAISNPDQYLKQDAYGNLEKHSLNKSHHNSTKKPYRLHRCSYCKACFDVPSKLKQHIDAVHEGKKLFKCTLCDASFGWNGNLKNHVESVHEKKKPFKCSQCDSSFCKNSNLKQHIKLVHEGLRPFVCPICLNSFQYKVDVKKHIESVHEGKKPFKCTICNSSYTRKLSLRQHIATVHEGNKPYACTLCKSSYTRKLTLRKHMATVHEVKNEPELEYDIIEELDRNAIKAEPITDYEDMEEENYSDKEKPSTSTQLSPLHYPEVSLTEDNSILDVHKVEKEIPYESFSSD